jgi:hypothetical protein
MYWPPVIQAVTAAAAVVLGGHSMAGHATGGSSGYARGGYARPGHGARYGGGYYGGGGPIYDSCDSYYGNGCPGFGIPLVGGLINGALGGY